MNEEFEIFQNKVDTNKEINTDKSLLNALNDPKEIIKPKILIIDDDFQVRESLKMALKKKYEIILAENGEDGIKQLDNSIFVVILDIKMEGKNGFDTFIEIKKVNPFTPIILHSAYQDLKDPFEIVNDYRPFGYVIKEGDGKKLHHTIENAIDYYKQIHRNVELVKELKNQNEKLRELQETLENKVAERTRDLTTSNEHLQKEILFRHEAENAVNSLLREKEVILQEVHHRLKNNMTTLKALLSLQAKSINEPTAIEALTEAGNRVQTMMVLYDKLYQTASFKEMSIKEYLSTLIDQIILNFPNSTTVKIEKNIEHFILGVKELQTIGIIINELLTNIMKYAFTNRGDGFILVSVTLSGTIVSLVIQDNGEGLQDSIDFDNSSGFGLKLIAILTRQLNGTIQIERDIGTKIILEFEMP